MEHFINSSKYTSTALTVSPCTHISFQFPLALPEQKLHAPNEPQQKWDFSINLYIFGHKKWQLHFLRSNTGFANKICARKCTARVRSTCPITCERGPQWPSAIVAEMQPLSIYGVGIVMRLRPRPLRALTHAARTAARPSDSCGAHCSLSIIIFKNTRCRCIYDARWRRPLDFLISSELLVTCSHQHCYCLRCTFSKPFDSALIDSKQRDTYIISFSHRQILFKVHCGEPLGNQKWHSWCHK